MRGQITINGRMFAIGGNNLYEVSAAGVPTLVGPIVGDGRPVLMVASTTQLCFASAGTLYLFDLVGAAGLTTPAGLLGPVSIVGYSDGFFIALLSNSRRFQISAINDASTWPGLTVVTVTLFPDNIVSMIVDHREIWLLGATKTTVYYNAGAPIVPFVPDQSAYIEQGIGAQFAVSRLDNSIFWIGADDRGQGIGWRAQGYTPMRITNYSIETAWAKYPTIADAVSYSYQDQGHSFWVVYFPSANATWVYDVAVGQWHRRGSWNGNKYNADFSQNHIFAFGMHLVGDWNSGNIYQQSINILTDNGAPIHRMRRSPHVTLELEYIFHHQLQIDMETGLGPQPPLLDGQGKPRDPIVTLRWSDDFGHTWSNSYDMPCGQAGKFKTRVIWRRLGRSRGRIYELTCSDPIALRIVDAYLKASPDFEPTERYVHKARKMA